MTVDAALVYLDSKPAPKWVFSSYHRKIYVTPTKLLEAGIAAQASQLGTLVLPPPAQTVRLISRYNGARTLPGRPRSGKMWVSFSTNQAWPKCGEGSYF